MNIDLDLLSDDLSSAVGTETLLAHDLVPEGLPASSKGPAEQQIHHIGGMRYLAVDQTSNRSQGLVAKIRIDDFRWFLPKWIIQMHTALIMIESESFRELIHTIAPALNDFMVSSVMIVWN
jgi:hypothetical protein